MPLRAPLLLRRATAPFLAPAALGRSSNPASRSLCAWAPDLFDQVSLQHLGGPPPSFSAVADLPQSRELWPDAALVVASRGGDRSCFDVLVRRHQRRTRAVVRAICRDRAESQDLTQEAFTRAWTNLDLLVEPARFGAWLARIAFACGIDWLRRRPPASGGDSLLENLPATEVPADAALAERELTTAVRAAIARLPARYRRPLVLYHLDGLRQDRIAEALGVAPGTVRSLVTRARHVLSADLARIAQEEGTLARRTPSSSEMADDLLREPLGREILHICNGHATMNPLKQAGVPGRFRLSCDPLLEGPCPPLWGDPWRDLRLQFLTGGSTRPAGAPAPGEEIWDDDVERALSAADGLDEIVLWYEHDLYDQLLLIRLLAIISRHEGAHPRLSLVCIGEHPSIPAFKGLGQLTPDQLASLFETRASITTEMIALGRDAWTAYTASDPLQLQALLDRDLSVLPFLARALRRHLEEYPGVRRPVAHRAAPPHLDPRRRRGAATRVAGPSRGRRLPLHRR